MYTYMFSKVLHLVVSLSQQSRQQAPTASTQTSVHHKTMEGTPRWGTAYSIPNALHARLEKALVVLAASPLLPPQAGLVHLHAESDRHAPLASASDGAAPRGGELPQGQLWCHISTGGTSEDAAGVATCCCHLTRWP